MDWGNVWNYFRSGIGMGFLVAVGLLITFILYYGFIASTGEARVARAKIRARQMIDAGEIPDERAFNYVYYMLLRVPYDIEAIELLRGLEKLKSNGKAEKPL